MLKITCPNCKSTFKCEQPMNANEYLYCPYCSSEISLNSASNKAPSPSLSTPEIRIKNIRALVTISKICWILLGIYLLVVGVSYIGTDNISAWSCICLGVWDTFSSAGELCKLRFYYIGNAAIPQMYEKNFYGIVGFAILNLLSGAKLGVLLCIVDLMVRHYILKNKWIF